VLTNAINSWARFADESANFALRDVRNATYNVRNGNGGTGTGIYIHKLQKVRLRAG
jgi:hypothetical protein